MIITINNFQSNFQTVSTSGGMATLVSTSTCRLSFRAKLRFVIAS